MNSFRSISLSNIIKSSIRSSQCLCRNRFSTVAVEPVTTSLSKPDNDDSQVELLDDVPTYFPPTFNFAAYVNKSETLKKFVELGVDLSKIERKRGLPQFILKLDFEKDVKKLLFFLHDLGLPSDYYGEFITKNPLIFKESIADLETRIYYLRSKKFSVDNVLNVVAKNPFWLSFSTRRIDRRLGWFQKNFKLTGDDVRHLTVKQPRLITHKLEHVRESTFSLKEEMGFDENEVRVLLMAKPRLWLQNHEELRERFDYVNNKMKISHDKILQSPEILTSRVHRMRQRHEFLKFLGKAQFDHTKPGYISLRSFIEGTDKDFILGICKSSLRVYDDFLKTL